MSRLTHLDIPDRASPYLPVVVSQILFALLCTAVAIVLRILTDLVLPGAGPFALTIPAVLVATLFGRWLAGAITQAISSLYAWFFVLPIQASFEFAVISDGPRVVVNLASGFFVVALAEMFRRTVRRALAEREMLLLELEHRAKNNFASIASVLRLQVKDTQGEEARFALQAALGRVESFSRAHSFLYRQFDQTGTVDMRDYLAALSDALADSLGEGGAIAVECEADPVHMPRERAITIGLLVNEVTTNSAKHAFGEDRQGRIQVRFVEEPAAYRLTVSDNGSGISGDGGADSLGLQLIDALTRQAEGTVSCDSGAEGTSYRFEFAR